jgi:hypothetical protein
MEDKKKTILTIEHCGDKTTVEMPWDAHVDDLVKAFYGAAVASTWHPKAILERMKEWSEERLRDFDKG